MNNTNNMSEGHRNRDNQLRIAALNNAVARAGQDGGIEGKFDVEAEAANYYQWLTGDTGLKDPKFEKVQKKK